jgi:hypothetical protein
MKVVGLGREVRVRYFLEPGKVLMNHLLRGDPQATGGFGQHRGAHKIGLGSKKLWKGACSRLEMKRHTRRIRAAGEKLMTEPSGRTTTRSSPRSSNVMNQEHGTMLRPPSRGGNRGAKIVIRILSG